MLFWCGICIGIRCINLALSFVADSYFCLRVCASVANRSLTFLFSLWQSRHLQWRRPHRSDLATHRCRPRLACTIICLAYVFVCLVYFVFSLSGEEAWFDEIMADENKAFEVFKSYKSHRKLVIGGNAKDKKFKIIDVKSTFAKKSMLDVFSEGELMNKRWFVQWASAFFSATTVYWETNKTWTRASIRKRKQQTKHIHAYMHTYLRMYTAFTQQTTSYVCFHAWLLWNRTSSKWEFLHLAIRYE